MRLGQPDALGAYVQHSRNREDVLNCAGSLYLPTAPLVGVLDSLRDSGERMVFVGKPCDVAALRALLKVYPQVADRVVATISFFCAGVPSQSATLDLLARLGVRREETTRFRYRGCGWPGRATATDANGQEHSLSYSDSWGQILSKHLQFRCKICPDGIGEFADIVCGDAWKTIDGYPDFDEKPGFSLILARTPRGAALLQGAQQAGFLEGADFDLSTLGEVQPFQKARRQGVAPRLLAMRLLGKPTPRFSGFHLAENARQAGAKRFALGVLGMSRRLLLVK
jgi:coenzyme F420 hydrogenase subunit beta